MVVAYADDIDVTGFWRARDLRPEFRYSTLHLYALLKVTLINPLAN